MSGKVFPERGVTEKGPPTLKVVGFMDWSYRLSKKGKRKKKSSWFLEFTLVFWSVPWPGSLPLRCLPLPPWWTVLLMDSELWTKQAPLPIRLLAHSLIHYLLISNLQSYSQQLEKVTNQQLFPVFKIIILRISDSKRAMLPSALQSCGWKIPSQSPLTCEFPHSTQIFDR